MFLIILYKQYLNIYSSVCEIWAFCVSQISPCDSQVYTELTSSHVNAGFLNEFALTNAEVVLGRRLHDSRSKLLKTMQRFQGLAHPGHIFENIYRKQNTNGSNLTYIARQSVYFIFLPHQTQVMSWSGTLVLPAISINKYFWCVLDKRPLKDINRSVVIFHFAT